MMVATTNAGTAADQNDNNNIMMGEEDSTHPLLNEGEEEDTKAQTEEDNNNNESETIDERDSYSDDDDGEEAEEEEDVDNASSIWDDFRDSWRQHCIAVLVAVVATVFAYYYQRLEYFGNNKHIITSKKVGRALMQQAPTTLNEAYEKHAHLDDYERTANVSFCGMMAVVDSSDELSIFDFHLDKTLIPSMALHFQADWLDDDEYESVLIMDGYHINNPRADQHPEISCLTKLQENSRQTFIKGISFYYKSPDVDSMYRGDETDLKQQQAVIASPTKKRKGTKSRIQPAHLTFTGFATKFVNMGPKPVLLYWDGRDEKDRRLVGEIAPFEALSTATRPGESFSVSPVYDRSLALDRWVVTFDDSIQYYEPEGTMAKELTKREAKLYQLQKINQEFAKHYLIHSGRTWFSHFPRAFPVHPMWRADFFGQKHTVDTIQLDPDGDSKTKKQLTLEVVSVTPRVFTIRNFLSDSECDALIQLAISQGLKASTVYAGSLAEHQRTMSTRSSYNAWLSRNAANLTDTIYRRAAHVFQLDESLLQAPIDDDVHAHQHSMAESLQVIRYREGEEYAPHHDWVIPSQLHRFQPTRFATLLLYLNDNFEGGETKFPRAVNSQYHDGIKVSPEKGMAVLFYNCLRDGNVDDLSQHGSDPVVSGEKFAANIWLWEPVIN